MATNLTSAPFTEFPSLQPTVVFPRPAMQTLSAVVFLSGVTILSYITSRRSLSLNPFSVAAWRASSWPRLVCFMVFITSWAFLFTSGVLVLGVGMSSSATSCSMGIVSCITFYVSSKIFIYLFLTEKVYIVWGTTVGRFKSKLYLSCLFAVLLYSIVVVMMILGRVAEIREDRACVIGLKKFASVTLLGYDLFLSIFLTSLFVYPIWKSTFLNKKLRAVATRTMWSALMALTTSTINILVLTLMHGKQLGFLCLSSCGTDVTINALVLFYVTYSPGNTNDDLSGPSSGVQRSSQRGGIKPSSISPAIRNEYAEFPETSRSVPEPSELLSFAAILSGEARLPPRDSPFGEQSVVDARSRPKAAEKKTSLLRSMKDKLQGRSRDHDDREMGEISIHIETQIDLGQSSDTLDHHFTPAGHSNPRLSTVVPSLNRQQHIISDTDDSDEEEGGEVKSAYTKNGSETRLR